MNQSLAVSLNNYIFIPMGDHCASALLLRELGLRQRSYPFDWIVHVDEFSGSCIPVILSLVDCLVSKGDIDYLLRHFLPKPGVKLTDQQEYGPVRNWIRFPHDDFLLSIEKYRIEEQKYKRRFRRLYKCLLMRRPLVFVCISRSHLLSPREIQSIENTLLIYNVKSRFLFITGQEHRICDNLLSKRIIQSTCIYRPEVPAYIEYSDNLYINNDLAYWRGNVKKRLIEMLRENLS
jgi:hypothetical protein